MAEILNIEPKSKDGLIKNLSEALEHARKGKINHLSIIYDYSEDDIRNYSFGVKANINLLLDIAKNDVVKSFPTVSNVSYGEK